MNTYICDHKDRNCPVTCVHTRPHEAFESWNRILKEDGKEHYGIVKCTGSVCRCDWWEPKRFVTCKLYDSGTGELFKT